MSAATFLARLARRRRQHDTLWIASMAVAGCALVWATVGRGAAAAGIAAVPAVAIVAAGLVVAWRRRAAWRLETVAGFVEARCPGLDNLLVTAAAVEHMPAVAPAIRDEVIRQADARVSALDPGAVLPLTRPLAAVVAAVLLAAAAVLVPGRPQAPAAEYSVSDASGAGAVFAVSVTVTPPPYLGVAAETLTDPREVRVPAGGTVRLVVRSTFAAVSLAAPGGASRLLAEAAPGQFELVWTPEATTTYALVASAREGAAGPSRLLAIAVTPDQRPLVRVTAPGRDLRLPAADGPLALVVDASDDHAVSALELRWVRMSGSGESFTFGEGRVPITDVTRDGATIRGRVSWPLGRLSLEAGESLVYRVVASDGAPGQPPGESESYTIDIGTAFETSGAGAAVAEEDRRYAISQQMVIVHTERALAAQAAEPEDAWRARTQGIAAEQRSVRAEVVFLGGGEVEDEVEEAAHGDELQEGRLENRGRVEMLRAMGEMSRAEARLIAGDARGALVFERRALAALLAAFDRRRYFLRTVPERARIDPSRRLTGDRRLAAPGSADHRTRPDELGRERALLVELAGVDPVRPVPAVLAARVAAVAPGAPPWPALAARWLAATDEASRRAVMSEIGEALVRRAAAGRTPVVPHAALPRAGLDGWWAEERRLGTRR